MNDERDGKHIREESAGRYAQWVLEEMKRRDWDQAYLARRSGLSKQTIGSIIHGGAMQPTAWQVAAISRAFKVDPNTVFAAMGLVEDVEKDERPLEVYLRETTQLPQSDINEIARFTRLLEAEQQRLLQREREGSGDAE